MDMSLSEAAKAVKKTKQTVLNAINAGRLSASKDHQGQWRIDSAELFRVYPVATIEAGKPGRDETIQVDALDGDVRELRARLAASEEVKTILARQVDDLRAERDRWRGQAEQLLLALPGALAPHGQPQAETPPQPPTPEQQPEPVQALLRGPDKPVVASEPETWIEVPDELEKPKKRGWLARWFGSSQDD